MKQKVLLMMILWITGCAGYFGGQDKSETVSSGAAQPLAVVGGGMISTDQFNEITPFIFRAADGSAWDRVSGSEV